MAWSAEKSLFIDVPIDRVIAMMPTILPNIGARMCDYDPESRIFRAAKKMSFLSYGENLMIAVIPTVKGSAVRIRSECSEANQVMDYGKNMKNIERFAQELSRLLGAPVYEG